MRWPWCMVFHSVIHQAKEKQQLISFLCRSHAMQFLQNLCPEALVVVGLSSWLCGWKEVLLVPNLRWELRREAPRIPAVWSVLSEEKGAIHAFCRLGWWWRHGYAVWRLRQIRNVGWRLDWTWTCFLVSLNAFGHRFNLVLEHAPCTELVWDPSMSSGRLLALKTYVCGWFILNHTHDSCWDHVSEMTKRKIPS